MSQTNNLIPLDSDYNNGAHPTVMQHLIDTNSLPSATYGTDCWSDEARRKIRQFIGCPEANVEFLVGGTQTNATVIDSILATGDGVIAAQTAHIAVHEAGAIENSGHKVLTIPHHNGKLLPERLEQYLTDFFSDPTHDHMVWPGMVYITVPTELGTLYTKSEIEAIEAICKQYNLPLFIDGARLGYALASPQCDFTIQWLAQHCHAFYIGGTKVGALCGEAVIFPHGNAPRNFFTSIKRHGALLAKGRLAGVQFDALFSNGLYLEISRHAVDLALQMRQAFEQAGFKLYNDSPTNQQFIIVPNCHLDYLQQHVAFECWQPIDDNNTLCRFVTSWATTQEQIDQLKTVLSGI
ncbi:MAG: aminotransferase class V-fold PLP-dependent enzyme [Muribaculaceae bacterium]|nr:aminotransferase class V-fold PLP-dependent enzyme [Muribaculaceae bacterium]